jgi:hypothetical protein
MLRKTTSALFLASLAIGAASFVPAQAASDPVRFVSIQADSPGTDDGSDASLN